MSHKHPGQDEKMTEGTLLIKQEAALLNHGKIIPENNKARKIFKIRMSHREDFPCVTKRSEECRYLHHFAVMSASRTLHSVTDQPNGLATSGLDGEEANQEPLFQNQ